MSASAIMHQPKIVSGDERVSRSKFRNGDFTESIPQRGFEPINGIVLPTLRVVKIGVTRSQARQNRCQKGNSG
jgi:hypothetical protein